MIQFPIRDL